MERRNKIEDFNQYGDLIAEYPVLRNEPPFVLGVAEEIKDFYEEQFRTNDKYHQAKQKEVHQPIIEKKLADFVSLVTTLSRIHEDQIEEDSPILIEKFKKIVELLEDDVEPKRGNKNKIITRIKKILAIIHILDFYNKNVFARGVIKEDQNLYLENRNRRYVNLFYYKVVDEYIPDGLDLQARQFLGYGSDAKEKLENILENILGFVLKPGKGGKSEFGKDGFTLEVDVDATNNLAF